MPKKAGIDGRPLIVCYYSSKIVKELDSKSNTCVSRIDDEQCAINEILIKIEHRFK